MSALAVSQLLQQTKALIETQNLRDFPDLDLLAIQVGLEKTAREIEALRTQPGMRQNYLTRLAEGVSRLVDFILPTLGRFKMVDGVKQVEERYRQISTLYEQQARNVSEIDQQETLPFSEVRTLLKVLDPNLQEGQGSKKVYPEEIIQVDEAQVLKEISDYKAHIDWISNHTRWPEVQQARSTSCLTKTASLKIAYAYSKLAQYHYYVRKDPTTGDRYWKNGLDYFKKYCQYRTDYPELNYQHWFDISTHYALRYQLYARRLCCTPPEKFVDFLQLGLSAVNEALQMMQKPEALFRKWLFLQGLLEAGVSPPESPLDALRIYLNHHPDSSSVDYLERAQVYGGELAKNGRILEAYDWFVELQNKKEHPVTYLYLGKVTDQLFKQQEALQWFIKAQGLAPHNLEIRLWLVSQKAKNAIHEIRVSRKKPDQKKVQEIVDIANEFCQVFPDCQGHLEEATSVYIPLRKIAEHFYFSLIPDLAELLARLRQYRFSIDLYQKLLEIFDAAVRLGVFVESERINLYSILGTNYFFLRQFDEAEKYHLLTIERDKSYLIAYENIIGVYAEKRDEFKLSGILERVHSLMKDSQILAQRTQLATIFFNFGTAYTLLGEEWLGKSQACYLQSLKFEADNWRTRIHLARTQVLTNQLSDAHGLLSPYFERTESSENPREESPQQDFQIKFCFSGICALLDHHERARQIAIEAAKTQFNPKAVENLQRYINEHKDAKNEQKIRLGAEIVKSIRKIKFDFRVGKIICPKPIIIFEHQFIGFHGTIDVYLDVFKEGIKPKTAPIRQYRGKGFYIALDREIACYFAMKKARDEGRGKPVLIEIYATGELVGKEIAAKDKITTEISTGFNFIKAPINGFEAYFQYYVLENSLSKTQVKEGFEFVEWTDYEYESFLQSWTRIQ